MVCGWLTDSVAQSLARTGGLPLLLGCLALYEDTNSALFDTDFLLQYGGVDELTPSSSPSSGVSSESRVLTSSSSSSSSSSSAAAAADSSASSTVPVPDGLLVPLLLALTHGHDDLEHDLRYLSKLRSAWTANGKSPAAS